MKLVKYFAVFTFLLILPVESSNAQIWKKIKNKTKQKVEDKVSDKISEKLAEAILGKMTEKFELDSNPYRGGTKISKPENLPEEYSFDWKYQMKITNGNYSEDMNLNYWLSSENSYIAYSNPESPEMFSVVDAENQAIVSYTEEEGKSFAMSYSYPIDSIVENNDALGTNDAVNVTELPDKEFLGYTAKGYEIDTSESTMIIYVTSDFDVKFSGNAAIPGQNIAYIFSNTSEIKDSLTMYMKFVDKSDPDNAMEMECVSIQKDKLVKKNSEYNFL
ncbi:MAG: hypothetical protein ABJI69_13630 [Balneola sp.]|jgi:hypothetical protein